MLKRKQTFYLTPTNFLFIRHVLTILLFKLRLNKSAELDKRHNTVAAASGVL